MRSTILDLECVPCGEAADFLERKPRPELLPLKAPGNIKLPDSIDKWKRENADKPQREYEQALVEWEAEWQQQIADCALDPDLLKIVAFGAWADDAPEPHIITGDNETTMLAVFWATYGHDRLVTYNGFGYDLLALMRRSDYLGVKYHPLNIDRYRSEHVDLQQVLWFSGAHRFTKGKSLKFYSRRFNLDVPDDDGDGAQVAAWVQAGDWGAIQQHLRRDLERTAGLAAKLGFWQPQTEKVGIF